MAGNDVGWVRSLPSLQVQDICIAYESGYGKGVQGRAGQFENPYEAGTPSHIAYGYGVDAGDKEAKRQWDAMNEEDKANESKSVIPGDQPEQA